jgi:peptidoglycan/xylan/chitin deacetylase (PgdA/CDA1 family)
MKLQRVSAAERDAVLAGLRSSSPAGHGSIAAHRTLEATDVQTLSRSPLATVASHTRTHPVLATLTRDIQRDEIAGSRSDLEALGIHAESVSYPFGKRTDFTRETVALVKEARYEGACSNVPGVVTATTDPFELPRVFVPDLDRAEFEAWLGSLNG